MVAATLKTGCCGDQVKRLSSPTQLLPPPVDPEVAVGAAGEGVEVVLVGDRADAELDLAALGAPAPAVAVPPVDPEVAVGAAGEGVEVVLVGDRADAELDLAALVTPA